MSNIERKTRIGMAALVVAGALTGGCSRPSGQGSTPIRPTPVLRSTEALNIPPSPTIEIQTPTPTETPTETPTPTPTETPTPTNTPKPTEKPKSPEDILIVGPLTIENGSNTYKVILNEKSKGGFWPDGKLEYLLDLFFGGKPIPIKMKIVDQPEDLPLLGRPDHLSGSMIINLDGELIPAHCSVYDPQTPDTYWTYIYPDFYTCWEKDPASKSYTIVHVLARFLTELGVLDAQEDALLTPHFGGDPLCNPEVPAGEGILKLIKR